MDYRRDIERLRALAVLSVLVYHFFPHSLPGGFIGVDVFFVISGFLITRILQNGLESRRFCLLEFYRRRIRRILPALVAVLTFLLIAGACLLFADEYAQLGRHTVASVLFLQNFLLYQESGYFDLAAEKKPLLHLWSLSVEEQFYLFWPLLLSLGYRQNLRPPWLIVILLGLSMAFNLAIRHSNPAGDFFWSLPRSWELLIGALATAFPPKALERLRPWRLPMRGFGLLMIGGSLLGLRPGMAFPGFWALFPTLGAVLIILAGSGPSRIRERASIPARWLESIGQISYPLYLWHWPLLSLGQIIFGGALSIHWRILLLTLTFFLAAASHHVLEKPFRRDPTWRGPAILIGLMLLVLAAGILISQQEGFQNRPIEKRNPGHTESPVAGFETLVPECGLLGASERVQPHCKVFNPESHQRTFVVWGDSSAIAWTPVLLELAKSHKARLIVIGHTSCPPLLAARKTHFDLPASAQYCQDGRIQSEVIAMIEHLQPDLIVFMGALGGYRTDTGVAREDTEFMIDHEGGEADRQTNQETLQKRLPETLDRLSRLAPTLVFKNWPLLPQSFPPQPSPSLSHVLTRNLSAKSFDRSYFDAQRRFVDTLLEDSISPRIRFFDPSLSVCDAKHCSNQIHGIPAYSDRYHITPKASLTYRDALDQTLRSLLDLDR
jgi:peptidoglycan/LPS O-acetylase OafA/YrhL